MLVLRLRGRQAATALGADPVVRREVPRVDDERVAAAGEVAHRLVGVVLDHRGDVAVGVAAGVAVAGHREVDVVVDAPGERVPTRPAGGAHVAGAVAVEELADEAGAVAAAAEPGARLLGRVERLEPAVHAPVVLDAVVLGVLAGGELCARRAAQRVRRDRVGELHALVGQQPPGDRHVVEVVVAHVVGEHEDQVGTGRPVGLRGGGLGALHHPHRAGAARVTGVAGRGDRGEGGDEYDEEGSRDRLCPRSHHAPRRDPEGPCRSPLYRRKTRALPPASPKRHDDWGDNGSDRYPVDSPGPGHHGPATTRQHETKEPAAAAMDESQSPRTTALIAWCAS